MSVMTNSSWSPAGLYVIQSLVSQHAQAWSTKKLGTTYHCLQVAALSGGGVGVDDALVELVDDEVADD